MTCEQALSFPRHGLPEVLQIRCSLFEKLREEGAGNAGCTLHPRSRVPKCAKKTHTSIQVQRRHSGIPCAMVLRLIRALPGERRFLPPSSARHLAARLDATVAAPGPHDFAVRCERSRPASKARLTPQRPSQPAPTFRDDRVSSPHAARAGCVMPPIWHFCKVEYFSLRDLTRFRQTELICPSRRICSTGCRPGAGPTIPAKAGIDYPGPPGPAGGLSKG